MTSLANFLVCLHSRAISYRCLGPAFDCCAHKCHVELGDGIQEVVSWFQDPNLLWFTEGAKNEKSGK